MITQVLNSFEELPAFFEGISNDFAEIDYTDYLVKELDFAADLHKKYFDSSTGPDGGAWQPNAPSTIRQKGHSTILRGVRGQVQKHIKSRKGRPGVFSPFTKNVRGYRLATSLTTKTRQTFGDAVREAIGTEGGGVMSFGTTVPYAIYNDQGTERIPARPHIGLTEQHLDKMVNRAADFTLAELAK